VRITYRPLGVWPSGKRTQNRERSRFRAGWSDTLNLLERELAHLGVRYDAMIVIEAGYTEGEIRLDGLPRRDARPRDPAVVLNFDSKYGPLRYGCDTYTMHDDNLRAIALALEALRAVDRYGVTKRGEQYAGWKALPDGSLNHEQAQQWIADHGGSVAEALRRTHPDHGGNVGDLARTLEARKVLQLA
jgi:hypothetical protein